MKWQTIDSAPRDGTRILGFENGQVSVINWDRIVDCWALSDDIDGWRRPMDATHWMPLPPPPIE